MRTNTQLIPRLILSALFGLSIIVAGCDDSKSEDPFPEATAAAKGLCQLAVNCGVITAAEVNQCAAMEDIRAWTTYVVDAETFTACMRTSGCDWVNDENADQILACMRLVDSSFACNATQEELHYCNEDSNCVDINCVEACQYAYSTSNASCGMHPDDDTHEKCLCYLK